MSQHLISSNYLNFKMFLFLFIILVASLNFSINQFNFILKKVINYYYYFIYQIINSNFNIIVII